MDEVKTLKVKWFLDCLRFYFMYLYLFFYVIGLKTLNRRTFKSIDLLYSSINKLLYEHQKIRTKILLKKQTNASCFSLQLTVTFKLHFWYVPIATIFWFILYPPDVTYNCLQTGLVLVNIVSLNLLLWTSITQNLYSILSFR